MSHGGYLQATHTWLAFPLLRGSEQSEIWLNYLLLRGSPISASLTNQGQLVHPRHFLNKNLAYISDSQTKGLVLAHPIHRFMAYKTYKSSQAELADHSAPGIFPLMQPLIRSSSKDSKFISES